MVVVNLVLIAISEPDVCWGGVPVGLAFQLYSLSRIIRNIFGSLRKGWGNLVKKFIKLVLSMIKAVSCYDIVLTVNIKLMFLAGFVERILDFIACQALHLLPVHALVDLHQLHGGSLVSGVLIFHLVVLQDVINVPFEVHLLRVGFSSASYLHIVASLYLGWL